jgi:uncharacterized protein (DUF3820 family)
MRAPWAHKNVVRANHEDSRHALLERLKTDKGVAMSIDSKNQSAKRKYKKPVLASLALMCSLAVGGVNAVVFHDPVHTVQNVITQIAQKGKDLTEYGEQAMRWRQTLSHYQQQLIRMQSLMMSFGLPQGQQMTEVPDDYMVRQRCASGGFSLSSLTQVFNLNPAGNITEQQKTLCANIQMTRNAKYNETVRFMRQTVPELQTMLGQLKAQRDASNNQGNVEASNNNALQASNKLNVNFQTWSSRMQMYDAYISSMEENQKVLASLALKGENNPIGTLVKTGVLAGALQVGN